MLTSEVLIDSICYQGYYLIDNFFSIEVYQALSNRAKTLHHQGAFKNAEIGQKTQKNYDNTIRSDQICWLDSLEENEAIQCYLQRMDELIHLLNKSLFLSLTDFETHFAVYPAGSFYIKHLDQFLGTKSRKISCVYYLNQHWQPSYGGALKLYNPHDELIQEVFPLGNRFICFNSELPHEVAIAKHPRYSIAGWMKTRSV